MKTRSGQRWPSELMISIPTQQTTISVSAGTAWSATLRIVAYDGALTAPRLATWMLA